MDIHNIMEDIILQYLEDILSQKNRVCQCEQCRLDMACYALNKVRPMYVVSSRGFIHTENKKRKEIQDEIDVYSAVVEAVDVISNTRRHEVNKKYPGIEFDSSKIKPYYHSITGSFYNFPQIVGRILDSSTLKPLSDVLITLFYKTGKDIIPMFNTRWQNPIKIVPQMEGTFTFWPAPIQAEKEGIQKDFNMNIEIVKNGFEPIYKFFFIRIVSSNVVKRFIKKENIFYLVDIFLNPKRSDEQ